MKNLDYLNIHSVNPLHFIFNNEDEYIEEKNGNKYLTFAFTDKKISIVKIQKTLGLN